ncbi:phospholipase b1, membrane-associated [Plakobranchus ocellatus]|uniref:Phospholipase b1, membrane-associated n=1 Tax=Plakobranchus ocellatus TaxID=259542 RepID=A0AAV4D0Z6_9GAST|nr:phospholipase b1, membrane-associated [Plakobranchus ocellatus]
MGLGYGLYAILSLCLISASIHLVYPEEKTHGWYDRYLKFYHETLPSSPELQKLWLNHAYVYHQHQKRASARYPIPNFDCHTQFPWLGREPVSVHTLHPADIDVAGNGVDATNILEDLIEYRGLSWSGGGDGSLDEGILTLPNILKKYNPNIQGYATGIGKSTDQSSGLNVADPGDTSFEMPGQARMLVDRMKATTDFLKDWKVITLFIGGNDLCDACNDWNRYSPENYRKNLQEALDILHAEVPRALVNVALIFDIAPVAQLGKTDL